MARTTPGDRPGLTVPFEIRDAVRDDVLPEHARQPIRIHLFGEEMEETPSIARLEAVLRLRGLCANRKGGEREESSQVSSSRA